MEEMAGQSKYCGVSREVQISQAPGIARIQDEITRTAGCHIQKGSLIPVRLARVWMDGVGGDVK
jgi:hypothetical protein